LPTLSPAQALSYTGPQMAGAKIGSMLSVAPFRSISA
jgi:hypothetical protein